MKRMKVFEMGSVALLLACFLRTCCIEEKSQKDDETEFFSANFEDKVVSVVRTRRLYSYDPVRWENPIPYDEGIFEKYCSTEFRPETVRALKMVEKAIKKCQWFLYKSGENLSYPVRRFRMSRCMRGAKRRNDWREL